MRCSFTATWFLDIDNTPAISLFSRPSRCIEIMARPVSDNSLIACCKRAPLLFEYPNFQLLVIKAPANLYNLYAVFFFLKWRWYLNRCGTVRCWTSHLLCRMASLSRHSAILPETCLFFLRHHLHIALPICKWWLGLPVPGLKILFVHYYNFIAVIVYRCFYNCLTNPSGPARCKAPTATN